MRSSTRPCPAQATLSAAVIYIGWFDRRSRDSLGRSSGAGLGGWRGRRGECDEMGWRGTGPGCADEDEDEEKRKEEEEEEAYRSSGGRSLYVGCWTSDVVQHHLPSFLHSQPRPRMRISQTRPPGQRRATRPAHTHSATATSKVHTVRVRHTRTHNPPATRSNSAHRE